VKAEADKAYADLQAHMTTGGPNGGPAVTPPPATLLSRFTEEQQASIARQVDRAIEGRKTRTDQPTWYAIHIEVMKKFKLPLKDFLSYSVQAL